MSHAAREDVLRQRHRWLWDRVFIGDAATLPRATIVLIEESADTGYLSGSDTIRFSLGGHDLDDLDEATNNPSERDLQRWRVWEVEVLHELVHEYQCKVIRENVSEAGRSLQARIRNPYAGHGHGDTFYTALAEVAARLGYDPLEMLDHL